MQVVKRFCWLRVTVAWQKNKVPLAPIQLPGAVDVSALPKLFEHNSAEFDFPAQQGVAAWTGQLALDEDFTQILNEQTTQAGKLVLQT